jgi:hypothetical protein
VHEAGNRSFRELLVNPDADLRFIGGTHGRFLTPKGDKLKSFPLVSSRYT